MRLILNQLFAKSNTEIMVIAIAGATGLTGKLTVEKLLTNPEVSEVIAIVRNPTGVINDRLKELYLENGKLSTVPRVDAFICCLGTTIKKAGSQQAFKAVDLDLPIELASQLQENGCTIAAVVSSIGADSKSKNFYLRTKGEMEEKMRAIGFSHLTILRPSIIDGNRKEKRLGEKMGLAIMRTLSFLLIGSLKKYKPTPAHAIAEQLVQQTINPKSKIQILESIAIQ